MMVLYLSLLVKHLNLKPQPLILKSSRRIFHHFWTSSHCGEWTSVKIIMEYFIFASQKYCWKSLLAYLEVLILVELNEFVELSCVPRYTNMQYIQLSIDQEGPFIMQLPAPVNGATNCLTSSNTQSHQTAVYLNEKHHKWHLALTHDADKVPVDCSGQQMAQRNNGDPLLSLRLFVHRSTPLQFDGRSWKWKCLPVFQINALHTTHMPYHLSFSLLWPPWSFPPSLGT